MTLRKALLAASMLVLPGVAGAQPLMGPYIGGAVGWNQPIEREKLETAGGGAAGRGKMQFDAGWAGLLSMGWGFGNGFRAEVEGNYRSNDLDKLRGFDGASPFGRAHGGQRSYGAMANVLYDFDFANFGMGQSILQPYLGAGVGYVWDDFHRLHATSQTTGQTLFLNKSDGRFAYQGIAGVAMPLTRWGFRGMSLTAEYRFLGTLDPKVTGTVYGPNGTSTGRVRAENMNNTFLIGLRYAFNQPPAAPPPMAQPAPAPAPAAQPSRTYLVFFDWDRADLTSRAREIIGEAAQNSRRMQVTRLEVAGHADRSGDAAYNQRLSQRRAEAVAAELVRDGVERGVISVQAFGESRPLVPTADGVREPQNRRVEIVLR